MTQIGAPGLFSVNKVRFRILLVNNTKKMMNEIFLQYFWKY